MYLAGVSCAGSRGHHGGLWWGTRVIAPSTGGTELTKRRIYGERSRPGAGSSDRGPSTRMFVFSMAMVLKPQLGLGEGAQTFSLAGLLSGVNESGLSGGLVLAFARGAEGPRTRVDWSGAFSQASSRKRGLKGVRLIILGCLHWTLPRRVAARVLLAEGCPGKGASCTGTAEHTIFSHRAASTKGGGGRSRPMLKAIHRQPRNIGGRGIGAPAAEKAILPT